MKIIQTVPMCADFDKLLSEILAKITNSLLLKIDLVGIKFRCFENGENWSRNTMFVRKKKKEFDVFFLK